jgi:hypothetical protein
MEIAMPPLQAATQYSVTNNSTEINAGRLQDKVDLSHSGAPLSPFTLTENHI